VDEQIQTEVNTSRDTLDFWADLKIKLHKAFLVKEKCPGAKQTTATRHVLQSRILQHSRPSLVLLFQSIKLTFFRRIRVHSHTDMPLANRPTSHLAACPPSNAENGRTLIYYRSGEDHAEASASLCEQHRRITFPRTSPARANLLHPHNTHHHHPVGPESGHGQTQIEDQDTLSILETPRYSIRGAKEIVPA
jgi:hypothetical protein